MKDLLIILPILLIFGIFFNLIGISSRVPEYGIYLFIAGVLTEIALWIMRR